MRLQELTLFDFKIFSEQKFVFNGKSTIIFGINGTGKSTVLSAIKYVQIIRMQNLYILIFSHLMKRGNRNHLRI